MNGLRPSQSILLLLFLSLIFPQQLFSQAPSTSLDSLRQILNATTNDTARVNTLQAFVKQFIQQEEIDSALKYCNEALLLSKKSNFKKGLTAAYYDRGKILIEQGNYPAAINDYHSELKIYQEQGDRKN